MPFVSKHEYDIFIERSDVFDRLFVEYLNHDDFVKKHEGTFASMNYNSNFTELKSKRDLLKTIIKNVCPSQKNKKVMPTK